MLHLHQPRPRALVAAGVLLVGLLALVPASVGASPAPRALGPGDHSIGLTVGGLSRSFIVHVPPGAPVAGRPLILVFHGADATAAGTIGVTNFEQVADRTGEVVAFLQGVDDHWNEWSGAFASSGMGRGGVNDVAYTVAVIHRIEGLVSFDHQRIVAAGFSNGALMVQSLGCQLAGQLAMIVPVEGEIATTMAKSCAPRRPITVLELHGTADAAISYDGGPIHGAGSFTLLSAPASVAKWAALDHCAKEPTSSSPAPGIRLTTYGGCRKKVHATLRTIIGGVHTWGNDIGDVVTDALPWRRA